MRIDTEKWEPIHVTDLFDLSLPKGDIQVKDLRDGDVPLITPSNMDNGLIQRIPANSPSTLYDAGCLTVDMFGNAYYQKEQFFVTAHGHINVLIPKQPITKYMALFVATSIKSMFTHKYGFKDMCTQKVLKTETINLPVSAPHTPDWQYMESYIESIEAKAKKKLDTLQQTKKCTTKIDVQKFEEFCVGDMFDIHPTKAYKATNKDLFDDNGINPVVVNSSQNNGIGHYTNKDNTEKAGIITFSDTTTADSIFYQPNDFVGYPHVQGVYPIGEFANKWNEYTLRFFAAIFHAKAVTMNVDYVNKFTREVAKNMIVQLPVSAPQTPDWQYMESYIKFIDQIAKNKINKILKIS